MARFGELGCAESRDDIGNVVAVFPGWRRGTILFSTHMDTVGTDTGIQPIIGEDGVIRTDGSTILGADDKSGIAGCLEVLALLVATSGLACPTIEFVVTVGEEGGPGRLSPPGRRQLERHARVRVDTAGDGLDHLLGTDGGRPDSDDQGAGGARRGGAREGHRRGPGGRRGRGSDAVGRIDDETVANIGTFTGGDARNIVPDHAVLEGMARSHDQEKLDAQLDAMRTACEEAAARHGAGVDSAARRSIAPTRSRRTPRLTAKRPRPSVLSASR